MVSGVGCASRHADQRKVLRLIFQMNTKEICLSVGLGIHSSGWRSLGDEVYLEPAGKGPVFVSLHVCSNVACRKVLYLVVDSTGYVGLRVCGDCSPGDV